MIKKILLGFLCLFTLVIINNKKVYALEINSTYQDVASTSSQAINLINYAKSYDSFIDSDYVVFCSEQYNYYIVWGDLSINNNVVSGSNIEYIKYYRTDTTGYSGTYDYVYGTDTSFSLKSDYVNTSNLKNYGFSSQIYSQYKFYYDFDKWLILIGSMFFAIMLCNLRRS